jgi:endo-1,4-beta-xylanase
MNGLRTLADARGIDFGISPDSWTDSLQIDQILKENSNLLNWHIWWQSTQTNYAYLDPQLPLIFFAKNNGMKVRISPLIWGFDVAKEYKDANLSKDEMTKVLTDRINGIMQRFSYADEWVVVNEAITSDGKTAGYDQNVWYRAMGTGYVDAAFQLARKNAPKAVLIYNDNGIEGPGPKTDAVYQMLKDLKVKGTPVDGVGMEFHLDAANAPSKTDMVATMQRFGSLGLGVYITELDVNVLHLTGSAEEKASKQAQIYSDVVQACLESGVCKSINVWGMSDKNSWLVQPQWQFKGGGETPLIFDDQYQPKLAYTAIQQALRPVNLGRPVKP